jgi:hypothetical protein
MAVRGHPIFYKMGPAVWVRLPVWWVQFLNITVTGALDKDKRVWVCVDGNLEVCLNTDKYGGGYQLPTVVYGELPFFP